MEMYGDNANQAYTVDYGFPSNYGEGFRHVLPQPRTCHSGRRDRVPVCQVPGCTADLSAEPKVYCMRKRICTAHMQAEVLKYPGNQLCRYCFQCAKVEPLGCFDGHRRSCRQALHKRKVRPAQNTAVAAKASLSSVQDACAAQAQLQQQQQALLLQQQQQQQQQAQQLLPPASGTTNGMQQQIAVAFETLSAACNMTDQLTGVLAAQRKQEQALAAVPSVQTLSRMQQQQQMQAGANLAVGEDSCASRTPSPCASTSTSPIDTPGMCLKPPTNAGPGALGDDGFESFLNSLLVSELSTASSSTFRNAALPTALPMEPNFTATPAGLAAARYRAGVSGTVVPPAAAPVAAWPAGAVGAQSLQGCMMAPEKMPYLGASTGRGCSTGTAAAAHSSGSPSASAMGFMPVAGAAHYAAAGVDPALATLSREEVQRRTNQELQRLQLLLEQVQCSMQMLVQGLPMMPNGSAHCMGAA